MADERKLFPAADAAAHAARSDEVIFRAMRHDLRELEAICKMQKERIERLTAEIEVLKAENAQLKRDWE